VKLYDKPEKKVSLHQHFQNTILQLQWLP